MGVLEGTEYGTVLGGFPLYAQIRDILGPTGTIIPIGDTAQENSARTAFTTLGSQQVVFTYSEAISAFDIPPTITGPGRLPLVAFNGTDEEADTPDATYWTRDDAGGTRPFSVGAWVNVTNTAATRAIFGKWDAVNTGENREWSFGINAADGLFLLLQDESANVQTQRQSDSAITQGSLRFFVATYDGVGGDAAGNTITLYDAGAAIASTATNNASYLGMENLNTKPTLGFNLGPTSDTNFFNGTMVGGPLGPFFTQVELSTADVLRLYNIGKSALGL